MNSITIVPFSGVPESVVEQLGTDLEEFGWQVTLSHTQPHLSQAFNRRRNQDCADPYIPFLRTFPGDRVLGVLSHDIYRYVLDYVNGMADLPGRAALVSLYRLTNTTSVRLVQSRLLELALHELGHTAGLCHCEDRHCSMNGDEASQGWMSPVTRFCEKCYSRLQTRPYESHTSRWPMPPLRSHETPYHAQLSR